MVTGNMIFWTARIVHLPFPQPEVIRTSDMRVETVQGPLRALENYLRENEKTVSRAELTPPGKLPEPELEYIDRII